MPVHRTLGYLVIYEASYTERGVIILSTKEADSFFWDKISKSSFTFLKISKNSC